MKEADAPSEKHAAIDMRRSPCSVSYSNCERSLAESTPHTKDQKSEWQERSVSISSIPLHAENFLHSDSQRRRGVQDRVIISICAGAISPPPA